MDLTPTVTFSERSSVAGNRLTERLLTGAEIVGLGISEGLADVSPPNFGQREQSERPEQKSPLPPFRDSAQIEISPIQSSAKSIRFADETPTRPLPEDQQQQLQQRPTHSILRRKENPHAEQERKRGREVSDGPEDEKAIMTPAAKAGRFQFVKSPAINFKRGSRSAPKSSQLEPITEQGADAAIRQYFVLRMTRLAAVIDMLGEKTERVRNKRNALDDLITDRGIGKLKPASEVDSELDKVKSMVCRNETYTDLVSNYTFAMRTFGWRIPVSGMFMHLPFVDFQLPPFPLTVRVQLQKKIEMASSVFVSDNAYVSPCL